MSVSAAGLTWGRSRGANSFWCIQITGCVSWCSCTHTTVLHPTLPSPSSGLKTRALATCKLQVRNTKTKTPKLQSILLTQSLSPSLRPSSRKLHEKNSTYHIKHHTELHNVFLPSRDFFHSVTGMIGSLHNAEAAAAAASVALTRYLITGATTPLFLMSFTSLFWLISLFSPRTQLVRALCP